LAGWDIRLGTAGVAEEINRNVTNIRCAGEVFPPKPPVLRLPAKPCSKSNLI